MRPIRLELEGFTAFRDRTVLDFADHELFVLTGPTGSGKSSLIDAMIFALYGSVPRYNDRSTVYPIISQGLQQARVRFDFRVGGVEYTAVRVVRRTAGGATTKEARLETSDQTTASGAKELSAAIEDLLGLSFDQFTTCVVLPQGKFAKFLNETPGERQDLLVKLLGLGLFERIGALAGARASHAQVRIDMLKRQIEETAELTRARVDDARRHAKTLAKLASEAVKIRSEWESHCQAADREATCAKAQQDAADRLGALAIPSAATDVAKQLTAAESMINEASEQVSAARICLDGRRGERAVLGDRTELSLLQATMQSLAKSASNLSLAETEQQANQARHDGAVSATSKAAAALELARLQLERSQAACQAHALRAGLTAGDSCPVCEQVIPELPVGKAPDELDAARTASAAATTTLAAAQEELNAASVALSAGEIRVAEAGLEVAQLKAEIKNAPQQWTEESLAARLAEIEQSDASIGAAEHELNAAEARLAEARLSREQLESAGLEAREALGRARDKLADLSPPSLAGKDIAADWEALRAWASEEQPRRRSVSEAHQAAAASARREAQSLVASLVQEAARLDLAVEPVDIWNRLPEAAGAARVQLEQLEQALERQRQLKAELKQEKLDHRIAKALRLHLSARRFERWLLRTAMAQLVAVASTTLRELSGGQYSFAFDEMLKFEVVDHHQADERRSTRTLSGGETFLASLALALGLTDQISQLASQGAARLDSMFLDEGFGSLDPDTLDVVATAIEELGSRGRMVGLITHVSDLAERVPVRFEVRKVAGSATVERVA